MKRLDVLLAGKNRMIVVKKTLVDSQKLLRQGHLEDLNPSERRFLWKYIFEYYQGCLALANGGRDGVVKAELGLDIRPASRPRDFGPLITHLLEYEDKFTFPNRLKMSGAKHQ